MGDGHKISSKKEKRKDKHKEEMKAESDLGKNVGKIKKSKRDKDHTNEASNEPLNGKDKKVKSSKKEKKDKEQKQKGESVEDQVLISDITKFVGELHDEFKQERENIKKNKKNKKKNEKSQEKADDGNSKHKVFNDDDDDDFSVSNTADNQGGEKVKKKKKSKQASEQLQQNVDDSNGVCESEINEAGNASALTSNSNETIDKNQPDAISMESGESHKKKKKKKKSREQENDPAMDTTSDLSLSVVCSSHSNDFGEKGKKKKKGKSNETESNFGDECVNVESRSEKKKRKKDKTSDKEESDSSDKLAQNDLETSVSCDSERKRKKKMKTKAEMDYADISVESRDESDGSNSKGCESKSGSKKSKKRKSHVTEDKTKEDEIPMKKKKGSNDTIVKALHQQSCNTPVFESEERQEKFKRLLGAGKIKDIPSNCDVNSEKQTPGHDKVSNGDITDGSSVSTAGQWNGTMFESAERQSKFIRLLGGAKPSSEKKKGLFSSGSTTPKKGLFGSLASKMATNTNGSSNTGGGKALSLQEAVSFNQGLEDDFNQALSRRLGGMGASGIGFVKDPAEGKKFHINTSAVKSTKFSDDDE